MKQKKLKLACDFGYNLYAEYNPFVCLFLGCCNLCVKIEIEKEGI